MATRAAVATKAGAGASGALTAEQKARAKARHSRLTAGGLLGHRM